MVAWRYPTLFANCNLESGKEFCDEIRRFGDPTGKNRLENELEPFKLVKVKKCYMSGRAPLD